MSSAPIYNLPTEPLALVFEYVVADCWPQKSAFPQAMLVCRRWRSVGINTPSLWANIDCSSDQPLDLFLERSRGYPLSVSGELNFDDETCTYSTALERALSLLEPTYMPRLKALELFFDAKHNGDIAAPLIAKLTAPNVHTPQLETLDLAIYEPQPQPFTPTLITSHSVRLAWIRLIGCFFPWGLSLPHLRYLELELSEEFFSFPYKLQDVLDTLCKMPVLDGLVIASSLPEISGGPGLEVVKLHKTVPMKHLKTLLVEGRDDECFVLWMLLECPALYSVRIITREPTSSALVTQALRQPAYVPGPYSRYVMDILSIGSNVHLNLHDLHSRSFPSIDFQICMEPIYLLRAVSALLKHVDTLKLHGVFRTPDYEEAVAVFTLAQRLRKISISGTSSFRPFVSVLSTPNLQKQTLPGATLPFPNLTEVGILSVDFNTTMDVGEEPKCLLGEQFGWALQFRSDAGHRLSLLRTVGCQGEISLPESWLGVAEEFKCIS